MAKTMAKRRGRPRKTDDKPITETVKVQCTWCRSSNTKWKKQRNTLDISGVHDGRPYTRIIWNDRYCEDCNRLFIEKQYLNHQNDG